MHQTDGEEVALSRERVELAIGAVDVCWFFFQLRDPVNRFLLFSRHFTSIVSCRARSFNEAIDSRSPAFHPARHHFHVVSRQQQKQLGRAVFPDTPAAHTGRMMDGAFPAPIGPSLVVGWD